MGLIVVVHVVFLSQHCHGYFANNTELGMKIVLSTCIIELGHWALRILLVFFLNCYITKYDKLSDLNQYPFHLTFLHIASSSLVQLDSVLKISHSRQHLGGALIWKLQKRTHFKLIQIVGRIPLLRVSLSQKLPVVPCPYFFKAREGSQIHHVF